MNSNNNERRKNRKSNNKNKDQLAPHAVANALHALALSNQALHSKIPKVTPKGVTLARLPDDDEGHKALVAVRRLMADEEKAHTYSIGGDNPDWTWSGVDLTSLITQGVNDDERVGDALRLTGLDLRYLVRLANSGTTFNALFRIVVTLSVDEAVTAADVFENVVSATTQAVYAQHPWDQRKQYRVIYDKTHAVHYTGLNDTYGASVIAHNELTLKLNRHVQYDLNSGTVEKGALQVWTASNVSLTDKANIILDWSSRLRYSDA